MAWKGKEVNAKCLQLGVLGYKDIESPDSMPSGVQIEACRDPPESFRRAEERKKMTNSSADDSPHRQAPEVTPTIMAGDSHRPQNSGPAVQTSEFGGNTSRYASPSNLNNRSKPRPRYSSYDSDVWKGGYHHSGTNGGYSSSPGNTSVRNLGLASNPQAKLFTSNLGFNIKPKHQQLSKRGINMVQASNKWTAGSGKVVKGQYNSWKDDQGNSVSGWDNKMRSTYRHQVQAEKVGLAQNEVKFGQISRNKLGGGGDSKLGSGQQTDINLTAFPAPSLPIVLSPHMIGFQNHGNTCYLNASLQALLGLPMLVTDAVNLKYAVDQSGWSKSMGRSQEIVAKRDTTLARNEDNEQQVKLVLPFLDITRAREYGEVDNVTRNMDLLKTELEEVDKQFIGNKMQDANEFMCRLIDSMKDNIENLFQDVKVDIPNLVNSNFLSEREETFECLKCKKKESNRHSDLNFYCTVARSPKATALGGEELHVPLQKLVDKTFETDEVRERRCDQKDCGHKLALTTNRLVRLPRVLVLHLKRYDYDQGDRSRKISRPVSLPAKLNLTKYVADLVELPNCHVVERVCLREAATPHPTLALNRRKRSRVESDDDNDNISSLKVQGVDRLDANNQCFTPVKFRGKTAEEIEDMCDNDKVEYTLHMSMKSEEENLAAAIKASLVDTPVQQILDMDIQKIFSDSPTTAAANKINNMDIAGDDAVKMEAPKTQANISNSFSKVQSSPRDIGKFSNNNQMPPDNDNNNDVGLPEHDYRLVSVVSHYGATTNSGHYVADVYSFDQGSWFRYDDTVVTPINELMVRTNSNNTKNGYIFMYVHEALAQKYDTSNKSNQTK